MTTSTDPQAAALAVVTGLTGPGGPFELAREQVLGVEMTVFRNRPRSLGEVLVDSRRHGDRDYVVTAQSRLSFAEHAQRVASLARVLREEHGVGKGDRVAILAANCPEWIVSFWAAVATGAIAVGFNSLWSRSEVGYALEHSTPKVVVADSKRAALIGGSDVTVLSMEDDLPRLVTAHPGEDLTPVEVSEDDPAVILYTSGTSGRPKGAVHSHRNLTSVIEYHRMNDALAQAFGDPTDPRDRRYLLTSPLFHIASLHNLALPRLATGSTAVVHQGAFDVDRVLRLIERERVTNWGAVPTMAHRLLQHGDLSGYDLSSLRAFSLASAPSSPEFQERLRRALPVAERALVDSYGLTESCTALTVATAGDLAATPGTLGRPIATVELEIRDEANQAVPEGVEGEICVRSPFNMLGYWNDPDATATAIDPDRWLHTGDIGTIERGLLHLNARRSDLIIRGGENVYPAEIEGALAEHPAVLECIVLGRPHEDLGQEVSAVVVPDPARPVTEAELVEFLRDRLAYYKVPTRWQLRTDPLPRNATGKVLRTRVEA
ncbi:Acyl-CoA synthetase (AMP-forming)/AMP-acid ligase II [Blastococcus sp. DSM 46786]|uniref:class I adenylate-forming enzyme family protein n=1 Tax=Blastococcus sp. DSM 46786 TaxID=1798227 RepID=UPI0008CBBF8B|nr:AMP-binding protein [Blastococcus sp. DSM 46786]SEK71327.1 Acyl-CoA synthetase (AMP-forming)/AMP-acid ligase II [Blastococcus sp. DSM 46786]